MTMPEFKGSSPIVSILYLLVSLLFEMGKPLTVLWSMSLPLPMQCQGRETTLKEQFVHHRATALRRVELLLLSAEVLGVCTGLMSMLAVQSSERPHRFHSHDLTLEGQGDKLVLCLVLPTLASACILVRTIHFCNWETVDGFIKILSSSFDALNFLACAAVLGWLGQESTNTYAMFVVGSLLPCKIVLAADRAHDVALSLLCVLAFCIGASFAVGSQAGSLRGLLERAQMCALLSTSFALSFGIRHYSDGYEMDLFCSLKEQSQEVLQEKLLAFEEEFGTGEAGSSSHTSAFSQGSSGHTSAFSQKEALRISQQQVGAFTETSAADSFSESGSGTIGAGTCFSAPAALLAQQAWQPEAVSQGCHDSDCLALGSLVWVEGDVRPRAVEKLVPGDRILCFDRLTGGMKHAAVLEVQEQEVSSGRWTTLDLADGTSLEVTADHPLHPVQQADSTQHGLDPLGAGRPGLPRAAAELQAGDHLLVLKVVPVPVQSVSSRWSESARISLTVQQSERHAIFVSASGSERNVLQALAVESANAQAHSQVVCRNTFIEAYFQEQALCFSNSAPPSICGVEACQAPCETSSSNDAYRAPGEKTPSIWSLESASSAELPRRKRSDAFDSSLSQTLQAPVHVASSQNNATLPPPARVRFELPGGLEMSETLEQAGGTLGSASSELVVAQNAPSELSCSSSSALLSPKSVGSVFHFSGKCKPCVHQNKFHFGYASLPCVNGAQCNFCHEEHEDEKRKRAEVKKETRRNKRLQEQQEQLPHPLYRNNQ
eukprot:TRINITY_DN12091_c0_g1_i6.p1 TRINITY_DN12091_c0_g1~~TRINITY_DN12091_c0_g1_i6.p1  ORF type:complete len:774 (-),score=131.17 TRINITY_DN12091_c0_g1_i6:75-2396(-)